MPLNRGRPRTRPPVRRMTVELDEALLAAVEVAAGASPIRVVIEEALKAWLVNQGRATGGQGSLAEQLIQQHARLSPPIPSDAPRGR
jgi:hypothetical protein